MPDESLLTNSSMNAPILEQEECSHSLTPDHGEPVPPHRFTSPRMKKLLAFSKTSKHPSLQVMKTLSVINSKKSHLFFSEVSVAIETTTNHWCPAWQVSEWEAVVYGKTEDQLIMTEQARQYLSPYPPSGSTSRALVL